MNVVVELLNILIWPALILFFLFPLRGQLKSFADRVTHVRVGGQEFIARTLENSQILLRTMPLTEKRPESVPPRLEQEITQLAASNPRVALLRLGREIEKSIRIVALSGTPELLDRFNPEPFWRRLARMADVGDWEYNVRAATFLFGLLYEEATTANESLSESEMQRLVDQGLTILGLTNAIRLERYRVAASGLQIFADEKLLQAREGQKAVLLTLTRHDGSELDQAFFTSRPDYYKPGMKVGYVFREYPPREVGPGWVGDPRPTPSNGAPLQVIGWDFQGPDLAEFELGERAGEPPRGR